MSETLKEIIENMPKDILINSFETVYEDSIKKDLEIERLHSIIKETRKETEKQLKGAICQEFTDLKVILRILDKEKE